MEELNTRAKSVAFSGHRIIPSGKRTEIESKLAVQIKRCYESGIRDFYCGMALGFDMMAAEAVLSLRNELPGIRLIAAVPYKGQADKWRGQEQKRYEKLLSVADKVILLASGYYKGCLLRRNDYMLANSDGVIAYFDGTPKGGTYYTCRKALQTGMKVFNLF